MQRIGAAARLLSNPFVVYPVSFGAVLAAYSFGWSAVYPPLSAELLAFFGVTFVASVALAAATHKRWVAQRRPYEPGRLPAYSVAVLSAFFAIDLIYTGTVPLIEALNCTYEEGETFVGVPHLHVLWVTLGSAFSAIRFADYLHSKRVGYLVEAAVPLLYFLLIVYRGPMLIVLVSWAFVYFGSGRFSLKGALALPLLAGAVMFGFGAMGNLRECSTGSAEALLQPSKTLEAVQQSPVPVPGVFLWGYLYLSSPTANLQKTVSQPDPEQKDPLGLVVYEMLPDFLSKRVGGALDLTPTIPPQVSKGLTVATIFSRAYLYVGWAGPAVMFLWLMGLLYGYLRLTANSPFALPALALACTLVAFCTFQNMVAYSAVSLHLLWPLALQFLPSRRRPAATTQVAVAADG